MTALTVSEVLDRAADRCARVGAWCQGATARDRDGRDVRESKCVPVSRWMMGHVADQEPGPVIWLGAFDYVRRLTGGAPTAWNDHPDRKQSEVVARLKDAAALARLEGR